jgi:uncharacterized protein YcbX
MSHYSPSFAEPARPDQSPVIVRTPSGGTFDVMDAALAAELHPEGARVIKQNRGVFDTFPLSLVTTQTLAELSELVGSALDARRFRPNILVESTDPAPFAEDGWVGRVLHIGGMSVRVDQRDARCAVITIDPLTTESNPAILRTVTREREGCVGVYGSTVQPGRIAIGDPVFVEHAGP